TMNGDCLQARKPAAFWLQLYGYDDAVREPTPDEERAMTYLTFIRGTRLLFYWLYKPMDPALWESMTTLRQELSRLEQLVTDDDARWLRVGTRWRRVHYALWERRRTVYLIACNASSDSVTVSFDMQHLTGQQLTRSQRWFDGRAGTLVENKLTIAFAPHQRQVFELT